jgi:hypothetical protein
VRLHLPLVTSFLALVVAGCAENGGTAQSGTKPPLSCQSFVDGGSALDLDIKSMKDIPGCQRKYHPGGQGYYESFRIGGIVRREAGSTAVASGHQLWVLVFRYYGQADVPGLDANTFENVDDFRNMPEALPVALTGVTRDAVVSRFELSALSLTMVCLDAATANADGSHTVVDVCRSAGSRAGDADVMATARSIAASDFPAINP